MLPYILALIHFLCPSCRVSRVIDTADAIADVAADRTEARVLVLLSFTETGFWSARHGVPFGATAFYRHHRTATLEDLATAALETYRLGSACGGFEGRMRMYLTGGCTGGAAEAARRGRIWRRIQRH